MGGNLGRLCRATNNLVRSLYGWKGDELAIPGGPLKGTFGLPLVHLRLSSAVPGCMPAMMPRVIDRHTPSLTVHSTWISFNVAFFLVSLLSTGLLFPIIKNLLTQQLVLG